MLVKTFNWRWNSTLMVGENSGPTFGHLWTKVHDILGTMLGIRCTFKRTCPITYNMFCFEDIGR